MKGMILLLMLCVASSAHAGTRKIVIDGAVKTTYTVPDKVTDDEVRLFHHISEFGDVTIAEQQLEGGWSCSTADAAQCSAELAAKAELAHSVLSAVAGDLKDDAPGAKLIYFFQGRAALHAAVLDGMVQYATTKRFPDIKGVTCSATPVMSCTGSAMLYPKKLWKAYLKSRGITEKVKFYDEGE